MTGITNSALVVISVGGFFGYRVFDDINRRANNQNRSILIIAVRGQTGKGANLALFGGAIMALCSGRTKRARLSFPDSFSLFHFFWRSKRNENIKKKVSF